MSKEKRNQLVLVVMATLLVMSGLYFFLIRNQQQTLADISKKKQTAEEKLAEIRETRKSSAQILKDLEHVTQTLTLKEQEMASGDLYAWMLDFIGKFKAGHAIDIRQFNSKGESAVAMFPKFPYREIAVTIMGSGFYHDIGRFIADFENRFPTARIMNLELAPESSANLADREKLTFKMDVVCLVENSSVSVANKP
ncbi:MAG TPA: type 4a pilus biogenesis protein PilO [Verrucomicrobia bacterium]|nr:type 4a pilus biogenesis protein PilO [Verrucomicrobiota bacterium]HOB32722.1 type 4a pilus biogenesis protein PilO [Verrucomicrobiota bacterium]HOP97840.1 type 4a pilus biogenesis protein PilO [Verrucomicrobiota bacterium]HPU57320.1 type 4a pilus biogenesis protein PilO [Verrucomicrobiota bacterium]